MRIADGNLLNYDFLMAVAAGDIEGYASVNKFGRNADVDSGATEEVWDGAVVYTFPTTATITHIRAAADSATTQDATIEVQGLNANWDLIVQTKDLDGTNSTTEVALDVPLIRVFRMKVLENAVMDEDIWVGDDDFLVADANAIIQAGNNQTLMAIYTVPNGKTAYMTNYYATCHPGGGAPTTLDIKLWARDNDSGYEKQLKHSKGVNADVDAYGRFQHHFSPYYKFNQKTDVYLTATTAGAAADVSGGFDLILVDNKS